jgi:hypothetical protein
MSNGVREPFVVDSQFCELVDWVQSFGVSGEDRLNMARLIKNYGLYAAHGINFKPCSQCRGHGLEDCERCGGTGFVQEPQHPGNKNTLSITFPVGRDDTVPNNKVTYKGLVYVFKPEGVFQILADLNQVDKLDVAPMVVRVYSPGKYYEHLGEYAEVKDGKLFFSLGPGDAVLSLHVAPEIYTLTVEEEPVVK